MLRFNMKNELMSYKEDPEKLFQHNLVNLSNPLCVWNIFYKTNWFLLY